MNSQIDVIDLAKRLINCKSVTPCDDGAIELLANELQKLGFKVWKLRFGEVNNLYARWGADKIDQTSSRHFCFAGHTDVVPAGSMDSWQTDPFKAQIIDNKLYGRGAVDMKPAISAFISACDTYISNHSYSGRESISLIITGDEEGEAINGTQKVLEWMKQNHHYIDECMVGEPTNEQIIGDMAKIGRRGSINFELNIKGTQGHVAYPHLANNPITDLVNILHYLKNYQLDSGTDFFPASNLEITSINVENKASNVIPGNAIAKFNIRFNNLHNSSSLIKWVSDACNKFTQQDNYELKCNCSAEAFLSKKGRLAEIIVNSIKQVTGVITTLSTTGGTSDARFIKNYCQVVEFGLINQTAHQVNEHIAISDILKLEQIYLLTLEEYFKQTI